MLPVAPIPKCQWSGLAATIHLNPAALATVQAIPKKSRHGNMGLWAAVKQQRKVVSGPTLHLCASARRLPQWLVFLSDTVTLPAPRLCWTVEKWPTFLKNPVGNWLLCSLLRTSSQRPSLTTVTTVVRLQTEGPPCRRFFGKAWDLWCRVSTCLGKHSCLKSCAGF